MLTQLDLNIASMKKCQPLLPLFDFYVQGERIGKHSFWLAFFQCDRFAKSQPNFGTTLEYKFGHTEKEKNF